MNIKSKKGTITIDGRSFSGNSVSICNNKVIVDGVEQSGSLVGDIIVVVCGHVEDLQVGSGNVTVESAGSITSGSGSVKCRDVSGSIKTGSGSVYCENVLGSIKTGSGSVYKSR